MIENVKEKHVGKWRQEKFNFKYMSMQILKFLGVV